MARVKIAAVVYSAAQEYGAARNRGAVERDETARYT
jgi:hypothetical protein